MAALMIPRTGTYKSRAVALRGVLGPALRAAFGEIDVVVRGTPDKPYIAFELPEDVAVSIDKGMSADPQIGVRRSDPFAKGNAVEQDWKFERFTRYGERDYDLDKVVAYVREQVAYNKRLREEVTKNEAAMKNELPLDQVPGIAVERNPRGGRYRIEMSVSMTGLTPVETALVLGILKRCKESLEPYAARRCERCGATPPEGEYLHEKWLPGSRREKLCDSCFEAKD